MSERTFARVGERAHQIVTNAQSYVGQPVVALCGTIFIPQPRGEGEKPPECRTCMERYADFLVSRGADQISEANDLLADLDPKEQ